MNVHCLVIGSGAAGLNAALQLRYQGIEDVLILTQGLNYGTSINTGSDKQTYYKLSLCGNELDSPGLMAKSYYDRGSTHGDLALVESSLSVRAFMHLVQLGVPFPQDSFGQFVGYQTDHDQRQRATSIGPYTSREMCRVLTRAVQQMGIPIRERCEVVELLTTRDGSRRRAAGAIFINELDQLETIVADNVIFAVGGPGGLYAQSVYPERHQGGIGLALMAGAAARNLPESQFGMASIQFRWNVSGSYMQVMPKFISTAADGGGEAVEFLLPYFSDPTEMNSTIFLKGYQWPFDAKKAKDGSSLIDLLVYQETVLRGRRVFLDFRENGSGFDLERLAAAASDYLRSSGATQESPIERLEAMNPGAIALYADHQIDLWHDPLEIAVCAQHNNGGLAGNHWWESINLKHFFPVGEVNGSHGVARPGGSALNAGQTGGIRAAEYIAARYGEASMDCERASVEAEIQIASIRAWLDRGQSSPLDWHMVLEELQERMSRCGAFLRQQAMLSEAVKRAWNLTQEMIDRGLRHEAHESREALRVRQLCFAHACYLDAILFGVKSGVGSRGSSLVLGDEGERIHPELPEDWRMVAEEPDFQSRLLVSCWGKNGQSNHSWAKRHPIPLETQWFERAWAAFQRGEHYDIEEWDQ
ncbi:MAG: FAD-binding protein [Anaerolineaceae bacterium]|nr:FAD-binding protein [Anaerolineaceae bacterium]